jgi:hypothetical protein
VSESERSLEGRVAIVTLAHASRASVDLLEIRSS